MASGSLLLHIYLSLGMGRADGESKDGEVLEKG